MVFPRDEHCSRGVCRDLNHGMHHGIIHGIHTPVVLHCRPDRCSTCFKLLVPQQGRSGGLTAHRCCPRGLLLSTEEIKKEIKNAPFDVRTRHFSVPRAASWPQHALAVSRTRLMLTSYILHGADIVVGQRSTGNEYVAAAQGRVLSNCHSQGFSEASRRPQNIV